MLRLFAAFRGELRRLLILRLKRLIAGFPAPSRAEPQGKLEAERLTITLQSAAF